MSEKKIVVLAFDIETSGRSTNNNQVIAIGACVMDEDFKQLDSFLHCNYKPDEIVFEERCFNEFWSNNSNILMQLESKTDKSLSLEEGEKKMIVDFVEFVQKWEEKAHEEKFQLQRVVDNSPFDVYFLNFLIEKHTSFAPFPYQLSSKEKYDSLYETHSEQRGLLMSFGNSMHLEKWGFSKAIENLFDVTPCEVKHDHLPNNDAYVIAREQQILNGIGRGAIKRKKENPTNGEKKQKRN